MELNSRIYEKLSKKELFSIDSENHKTEEIRIFNVTKN